jgi:hypothetical protein
MNWGKGLIIAMSSFVVFIIVLVTILMSKNVDLQSEDYYEKEIDYENEINAINNVNNLKEKVKIISKDKYFIVQIPDSLALDTLTCKFIRLDNDKLDKSFTIVNTKSYLIEKENLVRGKYLVELFYRYKNETYLQKSSIYTK